jgi:hypothetical protein
VPCRSLCWPRALSVRPRAPPSRRTVVHGTALRRKTKEEEEEEEETAGAARRRPDVDSHREPSRKTPESEKKGGGLTICRAPCAVIKTWHGLALESGTVASRRRSTQHVPCGKCYLGADPLRCSDLKSMAGCSLAECPCSSLSRSSAGSFKSSSLSSSSSSVANPRPRTRTGPDRVLHGGTPVCAESDGRTGPDRTGPCVWCDGPCGSPAPAQRHGSRFE